MPPRSLLPTSLGRITVTPTCYRAICRHSSSTSAIAYKARLRRQAPLPVADTPSWTAEGYVSNILYETSLPSTTPPKRHILGCLVQNEPGVLSRVSGVLAARGFNIDSLVVCSTQVKDLSRMTIVMTGQDGVVEQARRQLEDLVPVWTVLDYTDAVLMQRELLMAKINILGPEYFKELLANHQDTPIDTDAENAHEAIEIPETTAVQPKLSKTEALKIKHEHLLSITYLVHQFGGKVLDIGTSSCIVEISAKASRIDSFLTLVSPFGIIESSRTGLMVLPRSPLHGQDKDSDAAEEEESLDPSQLPPS